MCVCVCVCVCVFGGSLVCCQSVCCVQFTLRNPLPLEKSVVAQSSMFPMRVCACPKIHQKERGVRREGEGETETHRETDKQRERSQADWTRSNFTVE